MTTKNNKNQQADELILELKSRFGVVTDAELAAKFDIEPAAVSAWRSRGRVPVRYQLGFITEGSKRRLLEGAIVKVQVPETVERKMFSILAKASRILGDKARFQSIADGDLWVGMRLWRLFVWMRQEVLKVDRGDIQAEGDIFELVERNLDGESMLGWIETL